MNAKHVFLTLITCMLPFAPTLAFSEAENEPVAKGFFCRVLDAMGNELLPLKAMSSRGGDYQVTSGESEVYQYRVELIAGAGVLALKDLRNNSNVVMHEGRLGRNEEVAVTLARDELPELSLTLSCVGE